MNLGQTMTRSKNILAVLVLYKRRAEESQAYVAFHQLLAEAGGMHSHASAYAFRASAAVDLMLCDNSPVIQPRPAEFTGIYTSDPSNPGLAKHYNAAFRIAEERGIPWLMLFDQDTAPTKEYLDELLAQIEALTADKRIVAIVPKLHNGKKLCSPHYPPTWSHHCIPADQCGISEPMLHAFNSGAVLRVEALRQIGGFPEEFSIEYLDYATFSELQRQGGRLYVMKSVLRHELGMTNARTVSIARYKNILQGEWAFHKKYGTPKDRFYNRVRLLKDTLRFLLKDRYPLMASIAFRAAIQPRPR